MGKWESIWQGLSGSELRQQIQAVLRFQFNAAVAEALTLKFDQLQCQFSKNTGKLKHLHQKEAVWINYKPQTGTFSLSLDAARAVKTASSSPQFRVVIQNDVAPYIAAGKSVFAQHVIRVDPQLRPGDEVLVVTEEDELVAIGKMNLPACYLPRLQSGMAVKVRKGIEQKEKK
jgi:predicted RNA-binding protein (TIGR00451 family)